MTTPAKAIRIAILAMGGEGGGVLAGWIVDMAERNGYIAQQTSVPGVAQRTGATIYYVELFPESGVTNGRAPVLALMPAPGDVDIVIASELMEAGRAIQRSIVTPDRTTLIASTHRVHAMTEKLALGDGRVGEKDLLEACRIAAHRLVAADMGQIAQETGSVISAVLFGALAGSGVLPFARAQFEATIARGGVGVAASERGFAAGLAAAEGPAAWPNGAVAGGFDRPSSVAASPALRALLDDIPAVVPAGARTIAADGVKRLFDYQDAAYARLYLDRLKPFMALEQAHGDGSVRLTHEAARYLALGMAYEDTIRVAELKIRAERFKRVADEVKLEDGQILEIAEFLHPRLQEVADSVPGPLGRFIQRNWLARRVVGAMTSSGRVVKTTSISGFALLSMVARLKPRRRQSLRYAAEQQDLEAWLALLKSTAPRNYGLAVELAECRNLVKGYGDTHARGKANYARIAALAEKLLTSSNAPRHIAELRTAALADETGAKLRDAEQRLGLA